MLYFRLVQGGPHQQKDPATGQSRTYNKGEIIESTVDLNKKLDKAKERFKRLEDYEVESYLARSKARERRLRVKNGEEPQQVEKRSVAVQDPYLTAPHGQVSTGFQEATGTPEGTRSGLKVEDTEDVEEQEEAQPEFRSYTMEELMEMKVDELKELAQEENVDLKGTRNKEQVAEAIVNETNKRKEELKRQRVFVDDEDRMFAEEEDCEDE